jgi:exosortase
MTTEPDMRLVRADQAAGLAAGSALRPAWICLALLAVCAIVFAIPTFSFVARESWSTEQGAHGPIVLMTGLWLLVRIWPNAMAVARKPALWRSAALLAVLVPAYCLTRITQIVELEGYLMYACLIAALYSLIGGAALRQLWFPLFYLAFVFPPPETLIWAVTMPMKMGVSKAAVALLHAVGYPIGGEGVVIYVGQYQLLVAAACSGLNSIISLSAITLFYIYLRHEANWRYALLLAMLIVPVALLANFIRVLILILLTYHAGEAAAQGFLHNFAGLSMFMIALLTMFAIDAKLKPLWQRFVEKT